MSRRSLRSTGLFLLLLAGCAPGGVWSQVIPEQRHFDIRSPAEMPQAALPPVPPPATVSSPAPEVPPKELSLDEAIRVALANSRIARVLAGVNAVASGQTIYDAAISNTFIDDARAAFDPTLTVKNTWTRLDEPLAVLDPNNPTGTTITGARTDLYNLSAVLSKKTVVGGTLSLDVESTYTRVQSGQQPLPLNPQYQSSAMLSYTQPLLRGAGLAANLAPIVIARINTEVSFYQYKDSAQELVRGVIEAYWDVVFARTDLWAKRQQVEQGDFAYKLAEARLRAGLGDAAQTAQAKAALARFRADLVGSEGNVLQREAALRSIMGVPPTLPERLTLTTPSNTARVEPRWEDVLRLAGDNRPELIELKLAIEADQQNWILANNQARPQLDLVSYYKWIGLDGTTPTGTHIGSGPGQFADWSLGVNVSMPLGLRQDRARLRRVELTLVRDKANLGQAMHNAIQLVAGNVRNLAQFYEQYRAYKQARVAARENLDQQLARFRAQFKVGDAAYLNVLQAITDWGNAISSEALALSQYNTELANLERQTGTILEAHGVQFFEERFYGISPLGRCCEPKLYPAASPPGPNAGRYPAGSEPAEKALELERPTLGEPLLPPPQLGPPLEKLPEPRQK
jgi:outer membrane protein TolC